MVPQHAIVPTKVLKPCSMKKEPKVLMKAAFYLHQLLHYLYTRMLPYFFDLVEINSFQPNTHPRFAFNAIYCIAFLKKTKLGRLSFLFPSFPKSYSLSSFGLQINKLDLSPLSISLLFSFFWDETKKVVPVSNLPFEIES